MTTDRPSLETRRDPLVGQLAPTREMALESLELYVEQLSVGGLLKVRDLAKQEADMEWVREDG